MDEMIPVTIYKSTVNEYLDLLDEGDPFFETPDSMMEVMFPRTLVEEWFNSDPYNAGYSFETWYKDESTADDTIDLYQYAIDHGFHPDVPKLRAYEVQLSATYMVWSTDEDGAVSSAEAQHSIGDYYIYVDGKAYN